MATDNELRVQAERHEAAKAEVDPIKAVTSMAAVLGGKFFLLQVRITPERAPMLSACQWICPCVAAQVARTRVRST